ncbi:YcaO-like family protein [Pandoraea communis]|nr:YcaO-like family protein [Pandoraea communis]
MTSENSAATVVEEALVDPARVCPVFAAPALITGKRLEVQWRGEVITVRAPRKMLEKLFVWCRGESSLVDIGKFSMQTWGDDRMTRFVSDLLGAGVMVDAAIQLPAMASATNHPLGPAGLPAPRHVWAAVKALSGPPDDEAGSAISLAAPVRSSLTPMLTKRVSARGFGSAPLTESDLSSVLQTAYGIVESNAPLGELTHRRPVPSAGGLHTLRMSIVLLQDAGKLTRGCYTVQFRPLADGGPHLVREAGRESDVFRVAIAPDDLVNVRAIVVAWADLSLVALNYRNRAYPFLMFEAGAVFQNVALHCADVDLAWSPFGNYDPERMASLLDLPSRASVLSVGLLGTEQDSPDTSGTPTLPLALSWSDDLDSLPFHVAKARIDVPTEIDEFAWGRAYDPVLALDKAIAEAVERHAYRAPRRLHWGRLAELPSAIDPATIVSFSPGQYRSKDFPFTRLRQQDRALWTEAKSSRDGRDVLLLADCVFHRQSLKQLGAHEAYCWATSSGCASHISESLAQRAALWEVIERDAFMRHWGEQAPGSLIDDAWIPDTLNARIDWLKGEGCEVTLLVLDKGVLPVLMAVIQSPARHFTCFGAGAGGDFEDALHGALSEAEIAAHARLASLRAEVVQPSKVHYPWDHSDVYATRRYYRRADRLFIDAPAMTHDAFENCRAAMRRDVLDQVIDMGWEPFFVDLTLADAPRTYSGNALFTARAVVPGMIPVTFGYGRMPLGTMSSCVREARFPHPFA